MGVGSIISKKLTILFKVLLSHCVQLGGCKWLLNTIEGIEFYFIYIYVYSVGNDYICSSSASSCSSVVVVVVVVVALFRRSVPVVHSSRRRNSNLSLIKCYVFLASLVVVTRELLQLLIFLDGTVTTPSYYYIFGCFCCLFGDEYLTKSHESDKF